MRRGDGGARKHDGRLMETWRPLPEGSLDAFDMEPAAATATVAR